MLDVYVDRRSNFSRMKGYKLHRMLRGLCEAGVPYRVLDRCDVKDPAEAAFMHVDLTEMPSEFRGVANRYSRCINGAAVTIDRRLYSRLRLMRGDLYDGPVIVKTVLNSRGLPELRYRARANFASQIGHLARKMITPDYKNISCPEYQVLPSLAEVPIAVWTDERLMVERFFPGRLTRPYLRYRFEFFFDVELNTRSAYSTELFDTETVDKVDIVPEVPEEVRRIRRDLHLDFGAIDYFIIDGEAFVIDANKTVAMAESWIARFPGVAEHMKEITARLVDFARGSYGAMMDTRQEASP